jgi:hypothetical protein
MPDLLTVTFISTTILSTTLKRGRVTLYNDQGRFISGVEDWMPSALQLVYNNGFTYNETTLDEARERAK